MSDATFRIWDEQDLMALMSLEEVAPSRFRSVLGQRNENGRTYGGQLMAQALIAAARGVAPSRAPTMLQFLFLQGAFCDQAITYDVDTLQEGKRFSSRHVRGAQAGGRIVCDAQATFCEPMDSPEHSPPAPAGIAGAVPERMPRLSELPRSLADPVEKVLNYRFIDVDFIDIRFPDLSAFEPEPGRAPKLGFWIKTARPLPGDALTQAMALIYVSDWWINFVSCLPHFRPAERAGKGLYSASLNHAIWLHRPARADDWLYFETESPSAGGGRGLAIARIFDPEGAMVATATQESLITRREI